MVGIVQGQDGCWCLTENADHFHIIVWIAQKWTLPGNCNCLETSVAFWHCLWDSIPFSTHTQVVTRILHIAACRGHKYSHQVLSVHLLHWTEKKKLQKEAFSPSKGLSIYFVCPGQIVTQRVMFTRWVTHTHFYCGARELVKLCTVRQHEQDSYVFALLLTMIWHPYRCVTKGHLSSRETICWSREMWFYFSTTWNDRRRFILVRI